MPQESVMRSRLQVLAAVFLPCLCLVIALVAINRNSTPPKRLDAAPQGTVDANEWLTRWQQATTQRKPVTVAQMERAFQDHHETRSAHELALMLEFRGPVQADTLAKRFQWSVNQEEQSDKQPNVRLVGSTTDDVERLFYKSFEVTLDAKTHRPLSLRFSDRNGKWSDQHITLQSRLETNVADSSSGSVTTADFKDDTKRSANQSDVLPVQFLERAPNEQPPTETDDDEPTNITPKLKNILTRWAAASSGISSATFHRFRYDDNSKTERRATGVFYYESSTRGRYDIKSVANAGGEKSSKEDSAGKPYQLKQERSSKFVWTGRSLMLVDDDEKNYRSLATPRPSNTDGPVQAGFSNAVLDWLSTPVNFLPFSAGFDLDVAASQYDWELLKENESRIWMKATPREGKQARGFREVNVILNRKTFRTQATRIRDANGSHETVHVFLEWKPGPRDSLGIDPLKPDIAKYRHND
jgi:hypothetical protein